MASGAREDVRETLLWWTGFHRGGAPTKPHPRFSISYLPIASQAKADTSSCGVLAHNALEYFINPLAFPLLSSPTSIFQSRLRYLLEVAEVHESVLLVRFSPFDSP